jgi:integrase
VVGLNDAAVGCVYTKKAAKSTTFPVIIVSISVCTIISKRPASPMTSTAISSAPPAARPGSLQPNPLFQQDAHRIIRRRAKAAGIETRLGNHTFRATGITAYLKNSGKLEVAQQIANHESPRTTKLYDRRQDEISLDEIERITI